MARERSDPPMKVGQMEIPLWLGASDMPFAKMVSTEMSKVMAKTIPDMMYAPMAIVLSGSSHPCWFDLEWFQCQGK